MSKRVNNKRGKLGRSPKYNPKLDKQENARRWNNRMAKATDIDQFRGMIK